MIDCTQTKNYFAEKRRMTGTHKVNDTTYLCSIDCDKCPLHLAKNDLDDKMSCYDFEIGYLEKTIEVIQKWSDGHPQKTYLTDLLEKYPNIPLDNNGKPSYVCPHDLGLMSIESCKLGLMSVEDCKKDSNKCIECWNQIVEEG